MTPGTLHLNGITIDPVERTISHMGETVTFRDRNGRSILFDTACRLIIGPPATFFELCEALYGGDEDGGPEWGTKAVEVYVQNLKPKLALLKLRIYKDSCYRDRCYRQTWIAPDSSIHPILNPEGVDHDAHRTSTPARALSPTGAAIQPA